MDGPLKTNLAQAFAALALAGFAFAVSFLRLT